MGEAGGSADRRAQELSARGLRSAGAWAAGAVGERRVAEALAALSSDWLVLHDRLLFPGRSETNLDHVLVGPAGVVLIDAKNWAGNLSEWEGGLFKHQHLPGGERRHVPVHREVDKVMQMGTEMARRLQVPVLVVVALAGVQADKFGEARLVRDVWVVPVGQLVRWLSSRPVVDADLVRRLGVLVTTEFPSTTTDWRLLAAMGHDLDSRGIAPERPGGSRRPARRASSRPTQPGGKRRRAWLRPLAFLAGVGALFWALEAGVVTGLVSEFGSDVAGRISAGTAAGVPQTAPDTSLSCADVAADSLKQLRRVQLTAREGSHACQYRAVVRKTPVTVLSIKESHPYYPMTQQIAKSRKAKAPTISKTFSISGEVTLLYVAQGMKLKDGKTVTRAGRNLEVLVAHEALGLTATQGRQLAIRIAMNVQPPQPTASATAAG